MRVFEHQSDIPTTVQAITTFHEDPKALSRLTPPPPLMFFQVLRDDRRSLTEGEIEFRLWFGPFPVHWLATHLPGPTVHSFMDRMVNGPMARWDHTHIFEALESGVRLIDRINFDHKPGFSGWLTRLVFDGLPLRLLFFYRHWRTRLALRTGP